MRQVLALLMVSAAVTVGHARNLEVVGTGDGMELVRAIGSAFTAENPDNVILVPPSIGSGGGIAAVGSGKAELARVARPLKPSEVDTGLKAVPVFRLPTAIYVNSKLPVSDISHEQLRAIYEGKTTNWRSVGGPDLKIKVVRREDTDSSLSVLRQSMPGWSAIKITPRSKLAMTTQEAVETVKAVDGAIGFGPFSRALEAQTKVLSLDGVYPTEASYPTAVTISYVWQNGRLPEAAEQFMAFTQTQKAHALLSALGAVPTGTAKK